MKLARIVVVDDDSGVLRSVERVLGRNYEVASTASPQEAIQLTQQFKQRTVAQVANARRHCAEALLGTGWRCR